MTMTAKALILADRFKEGGIQQAKITLYLSCDKDGHLDQCFLQQKNKPVLLKEALSSQWGELADLTGARIARFKKMTIKFNVLKELEQEIYELTRQIEIAVSSCEIRKVII